MWKGRKLLPLNWPRTMINLPDAHPCQQDDGTYDHDWRMITDSEGDADVVNGINVFNYMECSKCGEQRDVEPEDWGDDFEEPYDETY